MRNLKQIALIMIRRNLIPSSAINNKGNMNIKHLVAINGTKK